MPENGVLLVNLGTPESFKSSHVGRFLTEFLSDPRVVDLPRWFWLPLLKLVIIPLRRGRTAGAYEKIWMDGGSPLMVYSQALCDGVSQQLGDRAQIKLAMRYGSPGIAEGLSALRDNGVSRLIILPMYPQYSVTTTASVDDAVTAALADMNWNPGIEFVRQYHDKPGWVHSIATTIRNFAQLHGPADRILFSMHGIPRRLAEAGDPYEQQCEKSVRAIAEVLKLKEKCLLTYQSRVGREPWLQPYTDEVIRELGESGVKHIQVISPGFPVDCLETLEEIAIRYRELFLQAGGERFEYIPALNDSDAHISLLASIVEQKLTALSGHQEKNEFA